MVIDRARERARTDDLNPIRTVAGTVQTVVDGPPGNHGKRLRAVRPGRRRRARCDTVHWLRSVTVHSCSRYRSDST